MRYKIEIWQWRSIIDTYDSDDINDILYWYKCRWQDCYESGNCAFYVYDHDRELSFDERYRLGFFY